MNIACLAICLCVLMVGLSCPSKNLRLAGPARSDDAELVIFFTGSELGSLRPCGCSGGQLGGLEKRSAVFDRVPASRRLIVGTGALVERDREQDQIKFRIFFEAFRLLSYDVVHLTDRDFEIATQLGLSADPQPGYARIHAGEQGRSAVFTKRFAGRDREVIVRIASLDLREAPASAAAGLFPPSSEVPAVDILILEHCDPDSLKILAGPSLGIEVIICPSDSDEPHLLSEPGEAPVVFTVGRFGRHICRLAVNPRLHFESIPVQEKLPDNEALVQLYRQYQQLVAQSDLLESYPRLPLAGGLTFVGSASCKRCHESEYAQWSTQAHADALASLKKVGSDRDPECVVCHVVGMEYGSGFVSEAKTGHLKDVGCENCHGPGSGHVLTAGQTPPGEPKTTCLQCHTPEKSTGYAGHEEEYMKKIVHWREPAAAGNVKN